MIGVLLFAVILTGVFCFFVMHRYSNMASTSSETPAEAVASTSTSTFANSEPVASGSGSSSANTRRQARIEDLIGDAAAEGAADDQQRPSTSGEGDGAAGGATDATYECTICLETAKDAVVSLCGHLFCWPCLHQWLETKPERQLCPVCKAAISRDKVIPLYGRDNKNQQDPRWVEGNRLTVKWTK